MEHRAVLVAAAVVATAILVTSIVLLPKIPFTQPQFQPTLHPQDVILQAQIKPADASVRVPGTKWVLEVSLGRLTSLPLFDPNRRYRYFVYAFDGQHPMSPNDESVSLLGAEEAAGSADFVFGGDGPTAVAAIRAAKLKGGLPHDYPENLSEGAAFAYLGSNFPIRVRYYLKGGCPPNSPFVVVLSYYEDGPAGGQSAMWTSVAVANPPLAEC